MRKILLASILIILVTSCNYFKKDEKPEAIARVGENYLFLEDIKDLVPNGSSKEDSLQIVEGFINRWASQKLMIAKAELNLEDSKKIEFDELVEQYKIDLYTKAYLEELVKQTIDTAVTSEELQEYYNLNKDNFRTSEALLKLRYIHLQNDNPKYEIIKLDLDDSNSAASERLNRNKNALLDSPQVLSFISGAVVILCDAIKADLLKADSGIAENLRIALQQVGENMISNTAVRELLNQQMSTMAVSLSDQYSEKVILFISERIHEWDSSEMINKIEHEVGGDLHMIRVNGVVVGAFIGLVLGVIRALVDLAF